MTEHILECFRLVHNKRNNLSLKKFINKHYFISWLLIFIGLPLAMLLAVAFFATVIILLINFILGWN